LVATLENQRNAQRRRRWPLYAVLIGLAAAIVAGSVLVFARRDAAPPLVGVDGLWLSSAEVLALPMSGAAWDEVKSAANAFDSSMTDYSNQDSTDGTYALAAALVATRTADTELRTRVVEAIRSIASHPYNTSGNPSALGWARTMTGWVIAGDLIDLDRVDPALDQQWRHFLKGMPEYPYPGDGGANMLDLAVNRANNVGAVARTAVTAIAIYAGDTNRLRLMAALYRAWVEGSAEYRFDWLTDRDRSWQCLPGSPSTYRGINPDYCVRDGNDLGGVLPDEFRRNGSYDPADYPGPSTTKYPWEALGAAITQADLLARAGYSDALQWGDQAPRRALERLWYLNSIAADRGWTFGHAADGGSDDRWIIPFINGLYGSTFPEPSATGPGRPLSWTNWARPT
jgi:hypothetical protein